MATINGIIRSYGAAVRRAERDQQRRSRESARRFKEQQKQQEIQDARQAVRDWNDYVEVLQTVHKDCTDIVNWDEILNTPPPAEPTFQSTNEVKAQFKLDNFKPSFLDKIFGSTQKKINNLNNQIIIAKEKDQKEYEKSYTEYQKTLEDWKILKEMAEGVKDKNPESYRKALDYFNPFAEIGELGTRIAFSLTENYVDISLQINNEDVIPNCILTQTSTGKLSRKNMSKTRFNELYQDHICSAILRIARETFSYLPVKFVRINAMSMLLNSTTGHLEEQAILSVIIPPETLVKLNLYSIDPSDSMSNFICNMNFKKTIGFSKVEKVSLPEEFIEKH